LGGRRVAFAAKLSADAGVFAVAASAIIFAVWSQDPGVQAAPRPARIADYALWNAPPGGADIALKKYDPAPITRRSACAPGRSPPAR
jgi:hypothetical protein